MVEPDDEIGWVAASRRGDHEAFQALIRRHQKMIHALTYRMTGSLADSEDLAQETFLAAYRKIDSFRAEARFSSWLCQIATNLCLNWHQSRHRREKLHRTWAVETESTVDGHDRMDGMDGDGLTRVQGALLKLHPKQRAAIVLTVYEGLNHAEAAKALGCSETTVSWRIFSARGKLRRWLRPKAEK